MPVLPPRDPAVLQAFARSIHELREAASQPTVKELASATGYSDSTVRDVLKGRRQQSRRAVQAVAAALGADAEEWGRRWDDLDLALHPPRSNAAPSMVAQQPTGAMVQHPPPAQGELYGDPTAGRFSPKTHPAVCSVEGCDRPYRARGLCKRHYDGILED